jgi:hypothetical protein
VQETVDRVGDHGVEVAVGDQAAVDHRHEPLHGRERHRGDALRITRREVAAPLALGDQRGRSRECARGGLLELAVANCLVAQSDEMGALPTLYAATQACLAPATSARTGCSSSAVTRRWSAGPWPRATCASAARATR